MRFLSVLSIVTFLLLSSALVCAQSPSAQTSQSESTAPEPTGEPAPLIFWNREITVLRSNYEHLSPAERASKAAERLAALPQVASWNVTSHPATSGRYSGTLISVNGQLAFAILSTDVDSESGQTLQAASDQAAANLRSALEARSTQALWPVRLKGIGLSLVATLFLILGLWLINRLGSLIIRHMNQKVDSGLLGLKFGGLDLRAIARGIENGVTKLTMWAGSAVLIYLWLAFVLLRFPYSQPWGQQLGRFLTNLFAKLGIGMLKAMPGIFTVAVIFLLTRLIARITSVIFSEIENGDVKVSWMHADTARATRRLVIVLIWIFAITVAYPYIPGSSTDAFKGVSVFVGLMVSLGSAGLINQVMSGLVVVYSRALQIGEYVRVGEDVGIVTEIGMLSTKILTRKREEVTIPNAVMVGTKTINYSRHAGGDGGGVGTTVTIGYDAPWRLVHEMLLHAAEQTTGVRKNPPPRVWQKSLSDFYVEYELVVSLTEPHERVPILSELHMHIQDAFNENGIQIMSPHFETQPREKVFVPRSQWFSTAASGQQQADGIDAPDTPSIQEKYKAAE